MEIITEKYCKKCDTTKPIGDFTKSKGSKYGVYPACKDCENKRRAVYREKNRERLRIYNNNYRWSHPPRYRRDRTLKQKYSITQDDYQKKLDGQNGVCAGCGRKPKGKYLYVDHDHETGRVRGLLCYNCNIALGWLHDNIETLARLRDYLVKYTHS